MSTTKPTIVLVHGAWHNAHCWQQIREQLENDDYETVAPSLLGCGLDSRVTSHQDDVAVVRKEVEALVKAGKEVVVVMHSYGGIAGGGAIEGLEKSSTPSAGGGGVIAAVFIAAFLAPKGSSLIDMFGADPPPHVAPHVSRCPPQLHVRTLVTPANAQLRIQPTDPKFVISETSHEALYNDVSPEESEPWVSILRPQAAATMVSKVTSLPWEHVPCTYIIATRDQMIYPHLQESMVKGAKEAAKYPFKTIKLDNSHSPWLSNPSAVVSVICEAAGQEM